MAKQNLLLDQNCSVDQKVDLTINFSLRHKRKTLMTFYNWR
jgi:hypothetical protein